MRRRIAQILAFTMALILLAGCTAKEPPSNGADPDSNSSGSNDTANTDSTPQTKTVTDVLDRTITLPGQVDRVVVTFNLEEYLAVAGAEGVDKLVGYSHAYWEGRREDAWATFTAAFPQLKDIPDVGYNDTISVESIISLAPDVVIMSSAVNYELMEPELERLEQAGIQVAFINYHAQTIEMHRKSTVLIGEIMDQRERAVEIADFYEEQMRVVTDRIAALDADAVWPRVYMEFSRGVGTYGNSWSNKMWGALIKTCGGVNIAADLSDGNQVDVAPELVLAENPDVVIFTASPQTDIDDNVVLGYGADEALAREHLSAYENREGWSGLNAVTNRRMGALYHDLSRHIFDFAGAQFLAKMIQPALFEDIDPEENLRVFFARYMPVELDGVWTITLR
jgi:iron complex transport system substrate-binding protein